MFKVILILTILGIGSISGFAQVNPPKSDNGSQLQSLTLAPAPQKINVQIQQHIQTEALVPDSTATLIIEETRSNSQKMEAKPE